MAANHAQKAVDYILEHQKTNLLNEVEDSNE